MFHIELLTSRESILSIQTEWSELYDSNKELSPFQSFEWNIALLENRAYEGKINFYCLYKNKKIILIAPFVRQNRIIYNDVKFIGTNTHADYLNFIHNKDLEYDEFYYFIKELLYGNRNIILHLNLIPSNSRINDFLTRLPFGQMSYSIRCVKIPICDNIDQYHATLSKRVKSRINHSIALLEKSFKQVEYRFSENIKLEDHKINEAIQLYQTRCVEQSHKLNLESLNAIKQYSKENNNLFLSECYINGKLAAIFLGFISASGTICIPITSYDSAYKDYNIGYVLLYNTICFLINQKRKIDYDLTRGTEEYKFKFGGVEHSCRSFIMGKTQVAAYLFLYIPYLSGKCGSRLKNEVSRVRSYLLHRNK